MKLFEHCSQQLLECKGINIEDDSRRKNELFRLCENAMFELCTQSDATFSLSLNYSKSDNMMKFSISRDLFENLIDSFLPVLLEELGSTIKESMLKLNQVTQVLFFGMNCVFFFLDCWII
jgi:molecular chaperone DnaK (HSP70)